MGKQHIATKAARMRAPAAYTGAFGLTDPAWTATIGAQRPEILLRQDAIPVPVPRLGAGKTSGAYAYKTPYMMSNKISNFAIKIEDKSIGMRTYSGKKPQDS